MPFPRGRHVLIPVVVTLVVAALVAWLDLRDSGTEPAAASSAAVAAPTLPAVTPSPTVAPTAAPTPAPTESAAEAPEQVSDVPVERTVEFSVATRGPVTSDLDEFRSQALATLNDARSWRAQGIEFVEVESGGDFTLHLATADQVPSFGGVCHVNWSCRNGRDVIINESRWTGASDAWNAASLPLRDYRHMVVNHEVGHWLGRGHLSCTGAGQPAPVMQQQSKNLQGCEPNPWPTPAELS